MVVAAACRLVGCSVERSDVLGDFERHAKLLGVNLETTVRLGKRLLGRSDLLLQAEPFLAEGVPRHVVALLHVEADEALLLLLELVDEGLLRGLDLKHGFFAQSGHPLDRFRTPFDVAWRQLHRMLDVESLDRLLDQLDAHVGALRAVVLSVRPARADVVGVATARLSAAHRIEHASSAFAAEHGPAQVVTVHLRPFSGGPLLVEQTLHGLERRAIDQRLVPPLEDLFVGAAGPEDDVPGVVAIAKQPLHDRRAERRCCTRFGRTGSQPESFHLGAELGEGVLAGGIQLKRRRDEGATALVDLDDRDATSVRRVVDGV